MLEGGGGRLGVLGCCGRNGVYYKNIERGRGRGGGGPGGGGGGGGVSIGI